MSIAPQPHDLRENQAEAIRLLTEGRTVVELAEQFGKHRNTIRACRSSEAGSKYFMELMRYRMAEMLPSVFNSMVRKAGEDKAPLIAVVKTFEAVANRTGYPEEVLDRNALNQGSLAIQINLESDPPLIDVTPSQHEIENAQLKHRIAELEKHLLPPVDGGDAA